MEELRTTETHRLGTDAPPMPFRRRWISDERPGRLPDATSLGHQEDWLTNIRT